MKLMKKLIGNGNHFRCSFFLFIIVLISLQIQSASGVTDEKKVTEPTITERAIGVTGLNSRWDSIKTWAKLAWMNIKPPDSSRSGSMKEAASRSFETSKETVEQSAASAAKAAGEAVGKTTEKIKRTMSSDNEHEL